MGKKVQGIRSINGRYKIDKRRLRIVKEMEKPKNLYVQPIDMIEGGWECWREERCKAEGNKREKEVGQQ